MKRIVALLGDFYHKEELARESLLSAVADKLAAKELEIQFVSNGQSLMEALLDGPDAVILFAENRVDPHGAPDAGWMTAKLSEQIVSYVENGGGWLAWHSGLASYPVDSGYVRMLRGYFLSHPEQHQQVRYEPVQASAAASLSESGFELLDEHYFVKCDEDDTEVFLRSVSVDGRSVAGWRHPYGAGRISCLTPAHRAEGLLDSGFLQALLQEVEWIVDLN